MGSSSVRTLGLSAPSRSRQRDRALVVGAILVALIIPCGRGACAEVLPRPTAENTARVYVLAEGLDSPDLTLQAKRARLADIRSRLGGPRLYAELGVAIRYREGAREVYQAASAEGVRLAVLAGAAPHHTREWLPDSAFDDPGNRQRLADGSYGLGAERGRYWASMSHYATEVREARRAYTCRVGSELAAIEAEFPGVIASVIGPDEVGLSAAGYPDVYADYSTHTLDQFRDWSAWTGAYAPGGDLAGQGQPERACYADAPRTAMPGAPRWEAWLAFRRHLVRAWTEDHVRWLIEGGLRPELVLPQAFLPADPTWRDLAGCAEPGLAGDGSVWVVDGSPLDTPWGIVLDVPESDDGGASLGDTLHDLAVAGCGVILLRGWEAGAGGASHLAGTASETALREFLDWRADIPLGSDSGAYDPPPVRGIEVTPGPDGLTVAWSPFLFEGSALRWDDWGRFAFFIVRADGVEVGRSRKCIVSLEDASPTARYTVQAITE